MRGRSGWPAQHSDIRRVARQERPAASRAVAASAALRTGSACAPPPINALRGLLYEFGVALPRQGAGLDGAGGSAHRVRLEAASADAAPSRCAVARRCASSNRRSSASKPSSSAVQKSNEAAQRLRQVPGIGLLGATALAATLGDGSGWRNAREFAMLPRPDAAAQRHRRQSDAWAASASGATPTCERCWSSGAQSVGAPSPCALSGCASYCSAGPSTCGVAVAHKLARTAWAMTAHGTRLRTNAWLSKPLPAGQPPRQPDSSRQRITAQTPPPGCARGVDK